MDKTYITVAKFKTKRKYITILQITDCFAEFLKSVFVSSCRNSSFRSVSSAGHGLVGQSKCQFRSTIGFFFLC